MFSLRNGSVKSHRRSQSMKSNTENGETSTDTIDKIDEEETGNVKKQVALTVSQELKLLTTTINSYVEDEAEVSSVPDKIESNGDNVSYADLEVEIENEPEKASTPIEYEKDKVNPFENLNELEDNCDMKSSEDENSFESKQINIEMNGIEEENSFEPIQVHVEMNGIESDQNSFKDDESCKDSVEKATTEIVDTDKMETNEIDVNSCISDEVVENRQAEVDSNDNISISARSYKYDDRKNPFMDELFDESLTAA